VKKYRKLAINKFGNSFFSKENNYGSPFYVEKRYNERLPSWWEFIQHVLNTNPSSFDEHYRPITLLCQTCQYDFNYILRYENISEEEQFFVKEIGAEDLIKSQWRNSNKRNMSDTELLQSYFNLLSNKEISKLYQIYRLDFEEFEYSFEFRGLKYNVKS